MRKPRDFDADLQALEHKARELKTRKVRQLGALGGRIEPLHVVCKRQEASAHCAAIMRWALYRAAPRFCS